MFRLRRYRVFLICAALIVFALVRFKSQAFGDVSSAGLPSLTSGSAGNSVPAEYVPPPHREPIDSGDEIVAAQDDVDLALESSTVALRLTPSATLAAFDAEETSTDDEQQFVPPSKQSPVEESSLTPLKSSVLAPAHPVPTLQIIDPLDDDDEGTDTAPNEWLAADEDLDDDELPAGRYQPTRTSAKKIHWTKMPERFPVPAESLITLPTGEPLSIPKIQHVFAEESAEARMKRERRQNIIRDEFKRSWEGYKQQAWMHDELSPVSGGFRDPFAGWGATLVDALDTLWIMGLTEEFEEAVAAVDDIDFTTSPRPDIPMFETTIRYMGGLLAAYDVSGGKYHSLLDKAVELGEILIGAFDTPNRMPILFYHWHPSAMEYPHRASERSNLAELGSMCMEFTRLAQLTKQQKYYDAVARITNAFEEWQNAGTKLDGLFPGDVNASGCNRTATRELNKKNKSSPNNRNRPPPLHPDTGEAVTVEDASELDLPVIPGQPGSSRTESLDVTKEVVSHEKQGSLNDDAPVAREKSGTLTKRQLDSNPLKLPIDDEAVEAVEDLEDTTPDLLPTPTVSRTPTPSSTIPPLEYCVPQGLGASNENTRQTFSMGGGHDSTYEYFPKQYLLLGGLEDQYRTMYLKAAEAIREHLIVRPMAPGNPDILIAAKVSIGADPTQDEYIQVTPEIAHLTCFIGGMVGMAAKIFNLKDDLTLAAKLTEGCVWSYSSMPSGIMPESAELLTCDSLHKCEWNQTKWYHTLDPEWDNRETMIADYLALAAKIQAEIDAQDAAEVDVDADDFDPLASDEYLSSSGFETETTWHSGSSGVGTTGANIVGSTVADSHRYDADTLAPSEGASSLRKRQLDEDSEPAAHRLPLDGTGQPGPARPLGEERIADAKATDSDIFAKQFKAVEGQLAQEENQRKASGLRKTLPPHYFADESEPDEYRPLTHEEFVEARISREGLPGGYVKLSSSSYILRPEAIESVWYMYRLTGDVSWQEKGWKMWEAVDGLTKTSFGNSAILDITEPDGGVKSDEMESFWLAETLKYFYLLYSTPDTISLDDWVLNTEAHPFQRPARRSSSGSSV